MDHAERVRNYYERWPGLSCKAIALALKLDESFVCRATGYPPPLPPPPEPLLQSHQSVKLCPKCGSSAVRKNGICRGRQLRECKVCGRIFIEGFKSGGVTVAGTGISKAGAVKEGYPGREPCLKANLVAGTGL